MSIRTYITWSMIALLVALSSCLKPVDSDFGGQHLGLQDDEILLIERIPASPEMLWDVKLSVDDSTRLAVYNAPLFATLEELVRDALNEKLPLYEDFGLSANAEADSVNQLRDKLAQMGGNLLNFQPLLQSVEVYNIVRSAKGSYSSEPRFLQLIWRDPDGHQADRRFGGIPLDTLSKSDYQVNLASGKEELAAFLRSERFYALPTYIRTNVREYRVRNEREALYLKESMISGNADQLEWAEDRLNISGKTMGDVQADKILKFNGLYVFYDEDSLKRELFLTAENDYLIADWSNRFELEKVLPYAENSFFSPGGELYHFQLGADSTWRVLWIRDDDSLFGRVPILD